MNLRTYRAFTLQQALDAVHEDMGPAAVILRTTTVRRGGILGLGRRTLVEVTASDTRPAGPVHLPGDDAHESASRDSGARDAVRSDAASREDHAARAERLRAVAREAAVERRRRGEGEPGGESSDPQEGGETEERNHPRTVSPKSKTPETPAAPVHRTRHRGRMLEDVDPPIVVTEPASVPAAPPETAPAAAAASIAPPVPRSVAPPESESKPKPKPESVAPETAERPLPAPPSPPAPPAPESPSPSPSPTSAPATVVTESAPADLGGIPPVIIDEDAAVASRPVTGTASAETPTMADEELEAIGRLVGDVLGGPTPPPRGAVPPLLFDHYLRLIGQEMSSELAERVIEDVRIELSREELERPEAVAAAVRRRVASLVPVASVPLPARSPDGRPLTIALVGPTGVGKTTTVAKLAAAFKLRHGRDVALVTADTYRVAAVEQLRTYAEIIDVPLAVADDPESMIEVLAGFADRDVVLIDTAGRSQHDHERIDELGRFIAAADPHEIHLVLSGTASERTLCDEAAAFAPVGVDKIVLTKLDEAVSFGMLAGAVHRIGRELSFVTTGQEVPDDLERGDADRLAGLAIGTGEGRGRRSRE